jgi:hypothetical protein
MRYLVLVLALSVGLAACQELSGPDPASRAPNTEGVIENAAVTHTVVDLIAGGGGGGGTDIGDVEVWNDAEYLYVKFVSTSDCFLETHVAVANSLDDIPQTKKGNPIPGQFPYSDPHACVTEKTYEIQLTWPVGTNLVIAAHAATGLREAMTFVSEEGETVYGPINSDAMPTAWGTAVTAVRAYNWLGYTRDLNDPDQIPDCTSNPLSSLTWSWGFGLNPTHSPDIDGVLWISTAPNTEAWHVDSWRKFVETFEVPGEPIGGSLQVNADNYYVVSNGETLGADDDIFNGPETYDFYPMVGSNTLEFVTENWAQGSAGNYCDQLRNPNGLTYKGTVEYYADGETAWGAGMDFPGNNWATYFGYTVQLIVGSWNSTRGDLSAFATTDAFADARSALEAAYGVGYHTFGTLNADLSKVHIAILGSVKQNESGNYVTAVSGAEQAALLDFVKQGGCAVLMSDGTSFNVGNNSLTAPFGLETVGGFGSAKTARIVDGTFTSQTTYETNYPGWYYDVGTGGTKLAEFDNENQIAAVWFPTGTLATNSGPAFAFSDINMFWNPAYDIGGAFFSDNSALFMAVIGACLN